MFNKLAATLFVLSSMVAAIPAPAPVGTTDQIEKRESYTGGYATYFYQGGNAGACGNYNSDDAKIVAIDSAWWPDFSQASWTCGKELVIQNNNSGKQVKATVADVCPTCTNGNSLDLSVGAFTAIASEEEGMVPITWWWA